MSTPGILTPSPESLRSLASEALRRAATARGLAPETVTADAVSGLTELILVAARIEAKADARTSQQGDEGVDSAA